MFEVKLEVVVTVSLEIVFGVAVVVIGEVVAAGVEVLVVLRAVIVVVDSIEVLIGAAVVIAGLVVVTADSYKKYYSSSYRKCCNC